MDLRAWDLAALRQLQAAAARRVANARPDHRSPGGAWAGRVTAVPTPATAPCVVACEPADWYPTTAETPGSTVTPVLDTGSAVPVVVLRGTPAVGADVLAYLVDGLLVAEDAEGVAGPPPPCSQYYFCYRVFGCCGAPLAGALVTLYGYDFDGSSLLGTGTTNVAGLACVAVPDPHGTLGFVTATASASGYVASPRTLILTRTPTCEGYDAEPIPGVELVPSDFAPSTSKTLVIGGATVPMDPVPLFGQSRPQWQGRHTFADPGECIAIKSGTCSGGPIYGGSATVYFGYNHCLKLLGVTYFAVKWPQGYGAWKYAIADDRYALPDSASDLCYLWSGGCTGSDFLWRVHTGGNATSWTCDPPMAAGTVGLGLAATACEPVGSTADAISCLIGSGDWSFF